MVGYHGDNKEEMMREMEDEMGPLTRSVSALMRFINNIGGHAAPLFSLVDSRSDMYGWNQNFRCHKSLICFCFVTFHG